MFLRDTDIVVNQPYLQSNIIYMKKYFGLSIFVFASLLTFAQPGKKATANKKAPTQNDMDKMMEEATKDMSPDEKAEMKKMMGGIMPTLMDHNAKVADYTQFTTNKQLLPKKDVAKISAISKKRLSSADIGSYAGNLYNKIITKGDAEEITLIKSITAKATTSTQFNTQPEAVEVLARSLSRTCF